MPRRRLPPLDAIAKMCHSQSDVGPTISLARRLLAAVKDNENAERDSGTQIERGFSSPSRATYGTARRHLILSDAAIEDRGE